MVKGHENKTILNYTCGHCTMAIIGVYPEQLDANKMHQLAIRTLFLNASHPNTKFMEPDQDTFPLEISKIPPRFVMHTCPDGMAGIARLSGYFGS